MEPYKITVSRDTVYAWKAIIPASGWYLLEIDEDAYEWVDEPGDSPKWYTLTPLIAWALVDANAVADGSLSYWPCLVGIVSAPPPNFEGPPSLCVGEDNDIRKLVYVHESEITPEQRERWIEQAMYLARQSGMPTLEAEFLLWFKEKYGRDFGPLTTE